jgi:hypothetical protein
MNLRPFDLLLMLAGAGRSVAGCFGDSIAVITAAHYGCFTLRPAIAEARTLVCELPVLADLGRTRQLRSHRLLLDQVWGTTDNQRSARGRDPVDQGNQRRMAAS